VKEMARLVTAGARGEGVTELIDRLIAGDLDHLSDPPPPDSRPGKE
jgi:hypothetical protein